MGRDVIRSGVHTADVISIRAKIGANLIRYSIVDEYDTEFEVSPASSNRPLSLAKLIKMIDNADTDGESLGR